MATDPSISLDVRGGSSGPMNANWAPSSAGSNPLAMIGNVVDTQTKLREFQARQLAGQIIAAAPNLETATKQLFANPITAAFAPGYAKQVADTQGAILANQGSQMKLGHDALSAYVNTLPVELQDPTQRDTLKSIAMKFVAPAVRGQLSDSIDYLHQAMDAAPPGATPEESKQRKVQDLSAWIVAAGAGDAVPRILGAPAQVNLGNQIATGRIAPSQGAPTGEAAGSFIPGGNALSPGTPPGYQSPGSVRVPGQGPGGSNPAAPAAAPAPTASYPAPGAPPQSTDGSPLVAPDYSPRVSGRVPGVVGGVPIGPAGEIATGLAHDFMTEGLKSFRNATASIPLLDEVDSNLDNMAKMDSEHKTNFMVPGAGADLRTGISKGLNTVSQIFGGDSVVDPSKVASAEDLMKVTQRMGPSVLQSLLGQQREAAETIKNMNEHGVPGINNSYLGAKLMTSSIRQATNRVIDMRNFENWWQGKTGGDLTGAEEEFNRLRPASGYINKALDEFGLTPNGFGSKEAVRDAFNKGYLTKAQAKRIITEKFPNG